MITPYQIELWDRLRILVRNATTNKIAFSSKELKDPLLVTHQLQVQNQHGQPIDFVIFSTDDIKSLIKLTNEMLLSTQRKEE